MSAILVPLCLHCRVPSLNPDLLVSLGRDRCGLVTHADLVGLGLQHDTASRRVARGTWQRLAPGIYLPRRDRPTEDQLVHAALLHGGPLAVVSGRAGCHLRGVPGLPLAGSPVTVLVPASVRRVSWGQVSVVRARELPQAELLRRGGQADVPVALLERCVADAVREETNLGSARATALAALRDKRVRWAEVERHASRPGPGARHLRRVVRDIADGVRSPAEADAHEVLRRASRRRQLPPYLLNPDLYLEGVLLGSPDFWFPGLGLGDEQDSREWHGSEDQLDATLRRNERFRRAGLQLHHTTPARFRADPDAHVSALRALVAERSALAVPEPPDLLVLARGPLQPWGEDWPRVPPERWR